LAFPTSVNSQTTDTVSQVNVTVLGEAPAMALGNLYQVAAQALGLMMQNAVQAQQQTNITAQAATTQGVSLLFASGAAQAAMLGQSDMADRLLSLLSALRAGTAALPQV
jgi:hypothetical protein